jgi:hypothetical protein
MTTGLSDDAVGAGSRVKQPSTSALGPRGRAASFGLTFAITVYLVLVAVFACMALIAIFPSAVAVAKGEPASTAGQCPYGPFVLGGCTILTVHSADQGLLLLALFAGVLGSFMHAAQSIGSYVGNRQLQSSWVLWYALRPMTGGILGLLFYFIIRAGLIPSSTSATTEAVSPYGVVAFGALAGWFSKRATDKLAEVFETLFRTATDVEYKDKLSNLNKPRILDVVPKGISLASHNAGDVNITLTVDSVLPGVSATLDGRLMTTRVVDATHLSCVLPQSFALTAGKARLVVVNPPLPTAPQGAKGDASDPVELDIQ